MSEQDPAPRQQPGRSSLRDKDELLADSANLQQSPARSVPRGTDRLYRRALPRATLLTVPNETAKQRHLRTTAYNLCRLRERRGWTQDQLAHRAEVRRDQVVKWESGKDYEPGAENLEKLCRALEADEREFLAPIPELEPEPA